MGQMYLVVQKCVLNKSVPFVYRCSTTDVKKRSWKAIIRKCGWLVTINTFHIKRDTDNRVRRTEVVHQPRRFGAAATQVGARPLPPLRYLPPSARAQPVWKPDGQGPEGQAGGAYSLAAITPDLVAKYRDERLVVSMAASIDRLNSPCCRTCSPSTRPAPCQ